jgi:SOS-response transcriptional repressor LexA
MAELTQRQKELAGLAAQRLEEKTKVPTQRMRTVAQGLTFGGADELEAFLRSAVGTREYEDVLNEIRGGLKQYQEARPVESLGYEVGGAAAPAIIASLFSGGLGGTAVMANLASKYPTIAKVLGTVAPKSIPGAVGVGAVQGGLTAFGKGESEAEDLGTNILERAAGVPGGAVFGGIGGGVGQAAAPYLLRPVEAVIDAARRKLGNRGAKVVETELQRFADESGMSVDEIVEGVANGTIMAENKTLLDAVRSYRATGGAAATRLKQGMSGRPKMTREQATSEMQKYLSDVDDPNILRAQQASDEEARLLENQMYGRFKGVDASPEVVAELESSLARMPEAGKALNKIFERRTGQAPFFIREDGTVVFARTPTVEEAELVRRTINNIASQEYKAGAGTLGEAAAEVEKPLREALDVYTPGLAETRATASTVRFARDAFSDGQKALSKSPDQVEIEFAEAMRRGSEVAKSYRAGVMAAYRNKLSTGSRTSLMKSLADPTSREGSALRIVMPEDQLPDVLQSIERAAMSQQAVGEVYGKSPTAITEQQIKRQGMELSGEELAETLTSPSIFNVARLLTRVTKSVAPQLTDAQRDRIVQVLVSEDPDFVRAALQDNSKMAELQSAIERLSAAVTAGSVRAGGVSSQQAVDTATR